MTLTTGSQIQKKNNLFGKNVYFFSFQKIKTKTNNFKNLHEAIISLQMNKQVEITRR